MAERYRKKPVVIEAMQVPPADDLPAWGELAGWLTMESADIELTGPNNGVGVDGLVIHTLEGDMTAPIGHWVIKGVAGEFYPCAPDIFAATYEPAGGPQATPQVLWETETLELSTRSRTQSMITHRVFDLPPKTCVRVVTAPTGQEDSKHSAAVELGRRGGIKGGPARTQKLSPERRSEIAKHAANTRWGNRLEGHAAGFVYDHEAPTGQETS